MLKAIKVRLYPNKTQSNYINSLCGSYRKVYNLCLDKKIKAFNNEKINLGLSDLGKYFHQDLTKNDDYSYLNDHNTKVLKQAILNLLDAYTRFFKHEGSFPQFKSKKDKQSCRFPVDAISKSNIYNNGKITLTKSLKNIKFECSERDKKYLSKYKETIKSATLTRTKSDKYFLSILIENNISMHTKSINDFIGVDIGIKTFLTCSSSEVFENLSLKRKHEKQIKKLQRQLSKKAVCSNNRNKIRLKLARKQEKLNNIKLNYTHNITTQLVRENQVIVIEDLNVKGMLKNHCLAKSIQDLSIHEVFRQLKYKCSWYDRELIEISRWFPSSKKCSGCGHINKSLKLSDRTWQCPNCGMIHDRDFNAAVNIKEEGKRIYYEKIGTRLPEFKFVDYPTMDDCHLTDGLKSSGRLKQKENSLAISNNIF